MRLIGVAAIFVILGIPVFLLGAAFLSVYQTMEHIYGDVDVIATNVASKAE
jgi:hypothetical protein